MADRFLFVGTTGSGKTTAAKQFIYALRDQYRGSKLYVVDTKLDPEDGLELFGRAIRSVQHPGIVSEVGGAMVWQPPINDMKQFDAWFKAILHDRKPSIVWVNELRNIVDERTNRYPNGHTLLMSLGRGHRIAVVNETQRIARVPPDVMAQTTHVLRFGLQNPFDRRYIDNEIGKTDKTEPPDEYGFFYKNIRRRSNLYYYKNWQELFGRDT